MISLLLKTNFEEKITRQKDGDENGMIDKNVDFIATSSLNPPMNKFRRNPLSV
jgi:hypothetical protein